MAKGGYIGILPDFTPVQLPSGYTQVEYIESTGTQYIDTGIIPTNNTKFEMDFQLTDITPSNVAVFGVVGQFSLRWLGGSNNYFRSVVSGAVTFPTTISGSDRHFVTFTKTYATIDDVTVNTSPIAISYPVFIFGFNRSGTASAFSSCKCWSFKHYESEVLMHNFIPCKNSSGEIGFYDLITNVFFGNAGTGEFVAGPGYESVARKIKKGYIGISNIARKIKKAYMGVGGVARPCWGGGDAVYYGTITPLSRALTNLVGGTIGDYALFAGGAYGSTKVGTVTTYNSSLVKGAAQNLDVQRYDMASANTGDYLLFAGGYGSIVVDYYSSSLTKGKTSLPRSISGGFGINLGEYAFVAANQTNRSIACVYDSNLTMTELPNMSSPHALAGAANVGEYAIIVGGYSGTTIVNTVEVYNTGLTKLTNLTIPIATGGLSGCGTKSKTYALFAGGDINPSASLSTMTSTVYCFNASLTLLNSPSLSVAKELMGAINIEDTIIFAGGWDQAAYAPVNTVDVYTDNLTRQSPPPNNLSVARLYMGCATVGGYGIFAGGGQTGLNALTANVDVYTL